MTSPAARHLRARGLDFPAARRAGLCPRQAAVVVSAQERADSAALSKRSSPVMSGNCTSTAHEVLGVCAPVPPPPARQVAPKHGPVTVRLQHTLLRAGLDDVESEGAGVRAPVGDESERLGGGAHHAGCGRGSGAASSPRSSRVIRRTNSVGASSTVAGRSVTHGESVRWTSSRACSRTRFMNRWPRDSGRSRRRAAVGRADGGESARRRRARARQRAMARA